jgi:hypothetical protein
MYICFTVADFIAIVAIQAQARCHRIGQTRDVKVYRLLTRKTYEMQMFHLSSLKMGLDQAVLKGVESNSSGDVSTTVIRYMMHVVLPQLTTNDTCRDLCRKKRLRNCCVMVHTTSSMKTRQERLRLNLTTLFSKTSILSCFDAVAWWCMKVRVAHPKPAVHFRKPVLGSTRR